MILKGLHNHIFVTSWIKEYTTEHELYCLLGHVLALKHKWYMEVKTWEDTNGTDLTLLSKNGILRTLRSYEPWKADSTTPL